MTNRMEQGFKSFAGEIERICSRYEEDLDALETVITQMGQKLDQTVIPTTSTPMSGQRGV